MSRRAEDTESFVAKALGPRGNTLMEWECSTVEEAMRAADQEAPRGTKSVIVAADGGQGRIVAMRDRKRWFRVGSGEK